MTDYRLLITAACLCALANSGAAEGATPATLTSPPAAPALARAVWAKADPRFGERLEVETEPPSRRTATNAPAFFAFPPTQWWSGLVPLFEVERETDQVIELRRRPAKGMENAGDPFCFILPLADELDAVKVVGRWECRATRPGGSESWFVWELACEGQRLSGRFDQGTEYRVAFLTGGEIRSNRVALTVEYGRDRYELTGEWREGRMAGTWRQAGEEERGSWQATAMPAAAPGLRSAEGVLLFEFRRGRARRYASASRSPGPGWERGARPLGRVWEAGR